MDENNLFLLIILVQSHQAEDYWGNYKTCTCRTRYVDGTPTSEVTPVTVRYIHPPHHGYPKFIVKAMNDQLTSLSFHVNQLSHSWNKDISKFDLESSKVKIMGMVTGQDHTVSPVSNWFAFFLFHISKITIPEIQLFWNLTLKIPRSRSLVRSRPGSHSSPSIQLLFVSNQSIRATIPEICP